MHCFIWYEDNLGFRIMRFKESTNWEDVARLVPDSVDVVELMNRSALKDKLLALAMLAGDTLTEQRDAVVEINID